MAAITTAVFASGTVFFVFAGSLLWTWLGGVWPFPWYVTAGMVPLLGCVVFLLNPFGKWWLRAIVMAYLMLADGWYIADGGGVVGYFFAVLILSSIPRVVLERRKG